MSIYWFCTKLCGIYALPSKTDFKAHTARFEFEGRSVWKEVESEKVLVLFCFCSSDANDVQMTTEMATGISSCDEPKMRDRLGRHGTSLGTSLFSGK
jgi:hypothetical protein